MLISSHYTTRTYNNISICPSNVYRNASTDGKVVLEEEERQQKLLLLDTELQYLLSLPTSFLNHTAIVTPSMLLLCNSQRPLQVQQQPKSLGALSKDAISKSSRKRCLSAATTEATMASADSNKKQRLQQSRRVRFNLGASSFHCIDRPCYASSARNNVIDVSIFRDDDDSVVSSSSSSCEDEQEEQEKRSMWYTRNELKEMKVHLRRFCRTVSIDNELRTSYASCCSDVNDTPMEEETSTNASSPGSPASIVLSNSHQFVLQRGLERWSSNDHCCERNINLIVCKSEFFIEQSQQKIMLQQQPQNDATKAAAALKLAAVYSKGSAWACKFAQLLGQADYEISIQAAA